MPLTKVQIKTGINRENTNYAGEGGFYSCDKIRFRSGYAEKIGGWITNSVNSFAGTCRNLFNWVTLSAENLIAVGTNQRYYVQNNGTFFPITPLSRTATLANPFTTVLGSNLVTVTDASFASTVGSFVTFSGAAAVGGLTISGAYEIVTTGVGTYQIYAPGATSSAGPGGGATVTAKYELSAGSATYSALTSAGWGVSSWGSGAWGTSTGGSIPLALWSQSNWGQDLIMALRGGSMYYWTKDTTTYSPAITINAYAETQVKTYKLVSTGVVASTTFVVPDTINIDVGAVISLKTGTATIPTGTYVSTTWLGGTTITVSTAISITAGAEINFSYSGNTAPKQVSEVAIHSSYQFVIALGSTPYDPSNFNPTFNPMLVRWSDQSVAAEWTPTTFNQSGEQVLANGSYIVGGSVARQELLIWTDRTLYSMQYIGAPFVFSFTTLMDNISIMSPNAMITVNNVTYWMGTDKFYIYNGTVQPLPCTVRQYVFHNVNFSQSYQVVCGHNEEYSEVWWHYPSTNCCTNDSYVIWNYADNNWYFGTMNRTAWYDTPVSPNPYAAISVQNSYLTSALTASSTSIPLIGCQSYPSSGTVLIDSEQIIYTTNGGTYLTGLTRGANGTTAAAHTQYSIVYNYPINQIVVHESGVDDGSITPAAAIQAYIETSDFDLDDGDHYSFVSRIIPDLTFDGSTEGSNPQVLLTLKPRQNPGSAYTSSTPATVDSTVLPPNPPLTYPVEQYTGILFVRVRGRQIAFRVESTKKGTTWQMGLMRFDIRQDGRR